MKTNTNAGHAPECRCWLCDSARVLEGIKASAVPASTSKVHLGGGSVPTRPFRTATR